VSELVFMLWGFAGVAELFGATEEDGDGVVDGDGLAGESIFPVDWEEGVGDGEAWAI